MLDFNRWLGELAFPHKLLLLSDADKRVLRGDGHSDSRVLRGQQSGFCAGKNDSPRLYAMLLPNARVLIHQPATGDTGRGQASDIEIQAREVLRVRTWLEQTLSRHSNKTQEEVNLDIERDNILSADEALAYGLIDQVLSSRKNLPPLVKS